MLRSPCLGAGPEQASWPRLVAVLFVLLVDATPSHWQARVVRPAAVARPTLGAFPVAPLPSRTFSQTAGDHGL